MIDPIVAVPMCRLRNLRAALFSLAYLLICISFEPATLAREAEDDADPQPLEGALDDAQRPGDSAFCQGERISTVAWSEDGTLLATAAGRRYGITSVDEHDVRREFLNRHPVPASPENTIRLWSVPRGELLADLVGHRAGIAELRFSPDCQSLASIDDEGDCLVWDLKKKTARFRHRVDERRILCCDWSADSQSIALGVSDGRIVVLSPGRVRPRAEKKCAPAPIVAIRSLTDGGWRFAAMDGRTGELRVGTFSADETPIRLRSIGQAAPETARMVHWSDSAESLVYCSDPRSIIIQNLTAESSFRIVRSFRGTIRLIAISPDRSALAALANRELGLITLDDLRQDWRIHEPGEITGYWPGPQGARAAAAYDRRAAIVREPARGRAVALPEPGGHWSAVQSLAWIRGGKGLLTTDGVDVLEWSACETQPASFCVVRRLHLPQSSWRCQLLSRELTDDAALSVDTRVLTLLTGPRWGEKLTSREIRQAERFFWGSDSNQLLLFAPQDNEVYRFSLESKRASPFLQVPPTVTTIVAGYRGQSIALLNSKANQVVFVDSQRTERESETELTDRLMLNEPAAATWAPIFVQTGRHPRGYAAECFDINKATRIWSWVLPQYAPHTARMTADGRLVAFCGGMGRVYLLDGLTGALVACLGDETPVTLAVPSPAADRIALADAYGIRILKMDRLVARLAPAAAKSPRELVVELADADPRTAALAALKLSSLGNEGCNAALDALSRCTHDEAKIARCLADLDSDDVATRSGARQSLILIGTSALPLVADAPRTTSSAEVRISCREIAAAIGHNQCLPFWSRSLAVLERNASDANALRDLGKKVRSAEVKAEIDDAIARLTAIAEDSPAQAEVAKPVK